MPENNSDNGWIKLHRKLLDNPISRKPSIAWYFIYCLLKANHKPKKILWNKKEITIDRGEFITGRNQAAIETGLTPRQIRTSIDWLVSLGQIEKVTSKTTSKYSVIKVIKYDTYQILAIDTRQQSDQQATSRVPASDQQGATNKNEKNYKNEKNLKDSCQKLGLENLKLYEADEKLLAKLPEQIQAWEIAYPDKDIIAVIRKAHAWELANPTKRKSDRIRFLNNWLSREGNGSNEPDKPRGIPANLKSPTAVGFTDKQRNIIVQLECWRGDYLCKARDDQPPGVDLNIDWTDIADDIKIEDFIKLPGQQNYKEVVK